MSKAEAHKMALEAISGNQRKSATKKTKASAKPTNPKLAKKMEAKKAEKKKQELAAKKKASNSKPEPAHINEVPTQSQEVAPTISVEQRLDTAEIKNDANFVRD